MTQHQIDDFRVSVQMERPFLRFYLAAIAAETDIAVLPTVNVDMREDQVEGVPWYLRVNANGGRPESKFSAQPGRGRLHL